MRMERSDSLFGEKYYIVIVFINVVIVAELFDIDFDAIHLFTTHHFY